MKFLADCITYGVTIQRINFTLITHYSNTNNDCPKLDPLCREIPLEGHDCSVLLLTIFAKTTLTWTVTSR